MQQGNTPTGGRTSRAASILRKLLVIILLVAVALGSFPAAAQKKAPDSLSPLPVEKGDFWKYFKGTDEPPVQGTVEQPIYWTSTLYNDSAWSGGNTGIGYGALDNATVLNDMQGNYISVFTRYTFGVTNRDSVGGLVLEMTYDDGFVAYLNGVEVLRDNLDGIPPAYTKAATTTLDFPGQLRVDVDPGLLMNGQNVLAVQIHNASISSSDLTMVAALRENGPYLQSVGPTSVILRWERYLPKPSKARYRALGDLSWTEIEDATLTDRHIMPISGLTAGTTYEYQISQDGTASWLPVTPATFRTAPAASDTFRVAAYGDSRTSFVYHGLVASSVAGRNPDLLLHLGDLVEFGKDLDGWSKEFFGPAAQLLANTPLYSTPGNHEYAGSGTSLLYNDFFSLPNNEQWYAFTYGCARWISLDTYNDFAPGSDQYNWLVSELQSTEFYNSPWQIVFTHYPAYTSGPHPSNERPVADYLVPLFEQYGVDLVLAGHNHHYERSLKNGIYYLVSGGGGAPLYNFPNLVDNPYSQVRIQDYHALQFDFTCAPGPQNSSIGQLNFSVRDDQGNLIDSLPQMARGTLRIYLPLVQR